MQICNQLVIGLGNQLRLPIVSCACLCQRGVALYDKGDADYNHFKSEALGFLP